MRKACVLAMIAVAAMAQQPENAPEKFYSAIRENNLTQLKALLEQKGSANVADDRGITPLMYAAEIGSLDAMRLLIDRGADVNAQNAFGSTALMWSVSDPAKVRLLLDHGAQVNTVARSGRTALIVAAFTNPSAEVVKLLLAKGAKVGVMDARHVTPLNAATFGNDTATVRAAAGSRGRYRYSGHLHRIDPADERGREPERRGGQAAVSQRRRRERRIEDRRPAEDSDRHGRIRRLDSSADGRGIRAARSGE